MGNAIGGKDRKVAKVMKINGDTLKLKAPIEAGEILKDYPGLVLMESESVKHYGLKAKPLEAHQQLAPRRLYFLLELPKEKAVPRRVRSGIVMSAKDRLESLMLARRSASDLSILGNKPAAVPSSDDDSTKSRGGEGPMEAPAGGGVTTVKVRLPKEEVERLMRESRDGADAAEKIMRLYINNNARIDNNEKSSSNNDDDKRSDGDSIRSVAESEESSVPANEGSSPTKRPQLHRRDDEASHGRRVEGLKRREKRVSFMAVREVSTTPSPWLHDGADFIRENNYDDTRTLLIL